MSSGGAKISDKLKNTWRLFCTEEFVVPFDYLATLS